MPDPTSAPAAATPETTTGIVAKPAEGTILSQTPDPAKSPDPVAGVKPEVKAETKVEVKAEDKKPAEVAKVEPVVIKLPDGFNADPASLEEFTKLATESGLKSEVAQKLVDFQVKLFAAAQAGAKKEADEFAAKEAAWKAETAKIPAADLGLAKRAMLHFTAGMPPGMRDETRAILQETWMGNHPGILKVLIAAGKFVAEDTIVEEGASGKAPFTAGQFYDKTPAMQKKK